jgi:diguanylate cyclase (GGDEF)-like protein/PAS domain S-box-containing protein
MKVLKAFALATISVLMALFLTLLIPPLHQQFKFLLLAFAVILSATRGIWPGVYATFLSAALAISLLMQPLRSLAISGVGDLVRLILFITVGLVISLITHRLQYSDEALRDAAAVVESSADSIMRQGLDGKVLSWNKAAERIYGYTAEEAIGRPVSFLVPPERIEERQHLVERVKLGGSVQGFETVRIRKDGKLIDVALTLSPVRNRKEKIVGVSSISREITARKIAEEALRQSHAKLSRQTRQLRLLAEMGEMLQASSIPKDAYEVTARFAQSLIPASSGALYVHSASKENVEVVLKWGEPHLSEQDSLPTDQCWGLRTGRVHLVEDSHTGLICRHLPQPPPECFICAPMIAHGETLGLLHLQINPAALEALHPGFQELNWPVRSMAERLALTLSDMKLREELRAQSICDPLTGWYNRRHMQETLERDLRRASRTKQPLSLLIFDIDTFKEFNDSYGHEAGDVTLQNLCQIVKTLIRGEDVACRYGGDEFVLILPDSSTELAAQRAEEIRVAVRHAEIQYQGSLLKPMTLSFGIATYPSDARTARDLLQAADTALFRAKSDGRDRVRVHGKSSESASRK